MATTGLNSSIAIDRVHAATDVVVGLTTDGDADLACDSAKAIRTALDRRGGMRWHLLVANVGFDGTTVDRIRTEVATSAEVIPVAIAHPTHDLLVMPFHGLPGRARALQAIFTEARARQAAACVLLDARSAAIDSASIERLLEPVASHAVQFLAPAYARHPLSGALVHGVVYPLFRALYGARLRWPTGTDFAVSAEFIDAVLPDPIWESDRGQVGIDLWLCTTAVCGGFRVGEAVIERTEVSERHQVRLSTAVAQVVGWIFSDMSARMTVWQRIRGSTAVPRVGEPVRLPDPPNIDPSELADSFRLAHRELQDVWAEVLPPLATLQWRRLASTPIEAFRVEDALWARTVYDFAMAHRLRVIARDHLLRSLVPLYVAWLASFVRETRHASSQEAEGRIEELCLAFETEKPYLISQWRWPERFKPVKFRR
jgi:glucosylglycerate synthase